MTVNKVGKDIPEMYAEQYGVFDGELANIKDYQESTRKIHPVKPREKNCLGASAKQSKKQA